nr:hypothetical protein [Desulfobulbaceae bacterium]
MATNPQSFFRFADRHYPLLLDLFYRSTGLTEADLRDLIDASRTEGAPGSAAIINQLISYGIIEPVPDATATFELTAPIGALLAFLLREHRLTSAKVIQGYLSDLEDLRNEIDGAALQKLNNQAARALTDISQVIERIRQDSQANREAILTEVLKLKANRDKRTVRERFEVINRLWNRHLEPLRDLIDVKKAMDASLDDLERSLLTDGKTFVLDGALTREFSRCRARLLRLRREVAENFYESMKEVEPLYISLKRESELVRGASLALEKIDRAGLASLNFDACLAIPIWRLEGTFSDTYLEAFFHEVQGYEPTVPQPLPAAEEIPLHEFILPSDLFARLDASVPVPDLLTWLLAQYPKATAGELVRAYGRIYLGDPREMHFNEEVQRYAFSDIFLIARPLQIGKRL